jgi:indole-3-glycerol phosphate synthase
VTSGFLAEIVREVLEDVQRPDYAADLPASSLEPRPSLRSAIDRERATGALLVEFKRISPGRPDPVLPVRTPKEFVATTGVPGLAGYSCIATRPRFYGSPADVAELARATDRPILFKDFVVDVRQLDAAVRAGASAVLLIARLETDGLSPLPLVELGREAHERGLEVLLELHHPADLARVDRVGADLFGVNARDLDTLTIDRPVAERTLEEAWSHGLKPILGLSGIERAADARRFLDAGADGILVGSAVARAADPAAFLRSLTETGAVGKR